MGRKKQKQSVPLVQPVMENVSLASQNLLEKLFGSNVAVDFQLGHNEELSAIISGAKDLGALDKQPNLDARKVLTNFFDVLDFQRKQRGNLLGVFVDGEYSIGPQMREQLLLLPKKFESLQDNTAWAAAQLGSFVINFKVVFDISNTFCGAKLFVIETESDCDENVKHMTLLDEVLQVYDYYFRDAVFEKWHIYREEQQLEKTNIVQRYLEMQAEDLHFSRELEDILAQLYLVRMLQFLIALGEKGQKVRAEFAQVLQEKIAQEPYFAQQHAMQKFILDNILMQHDVFDEIAKSQEGLKILDAYSKPLQNLRAKSTPVITEAAELGRTDGAGKGADKGANGKGADKGADKGAENDPNASGPANESGAKKNGKEKTAAKGGDKAAKEKGGANDGGKAPSFSMKDVKPASSGGGITRPGGKGGPAAKPTPNAAASAQQNPNKQNTTAATFAPAAPVTSAAAAAKNASQPKQTAQPEKAGKNAGQSAAPAAENASQQKTALDIGSTLAMAQSLVDDDENNFSLNVQQAAQNNSLPFEELRPEKNARQKDQQGAELNF